MGARDPEVLADGLQLPMEGCYGSGQAFGPEGPARSLAAVARGLIDAHLG